jgi:prephenate dehydratase
VLHRVAFLGPAGTFSDDALRVAAQNAFIEPRPAATVYEAIRAVALGEVDRALVPFENSIEGSVRSTLDTLAFEDFQVTIAGEHDHPIRNSLIARDSIELERIEVVLSHPQASAQCARFIREELPRARVQAAPSTAEAVREVSSSSEPWAALGAASAARIYGCVVLREGVEDTPDNVTRFVWIAPAGTTVAGAGPWRTTLVFSELGADHPGALVEALREFSSRDVNLTRIESRPRRRGLGQYMFFLDLDGSAEDEAVAEAIEALRDKAESVRILGTYPIAANGIPGT